MKLTIEQRDGHDYVINAIGGRILLTSPVAKLIDEGFKPTSPHHAAGMRMEPPPSEPCAIAHKPAASAAPAPPDDPPGVRSVSHGLRAVG